MNTFQQYCFHFQVVKWGKYVRRKYSLKNFHTCHLKIPWDRQGGELAWVKGFSNLIAYLIQSNRLIAYLIQSNRLIAYLIQSNHLIAYLIQSNHLIAY